MVRKITEFDLVGQYLNDYGRSYYLRELASLIKKPHQTIKPYLEKLVSEKVIVKNRRRKVVEYRLNFKEHNTYEYIVIAEKERTMHRTSQDTILKVLFDNLSAFFANSTFIIFGSAVIQIRKDADIDLLVIGKQDVSKETGDFEQVYDKKIHKIQVASIENLTPALIKEIYGKHIILNNTEFIVRFFGGLYEQNKLV